jgi:hypothetical protein
MARKPTLIMAPAAAAAASSPKPPTASHHPHINTLRALIMMMAFGSLAQPSLTQSMPAGAGSMPSGGSGPVPSGGSGSWSFSPPGWPSTAPNGAAPPPSRPPPLHTACAGSRALALHGPWLMLLLVCPLRPTRSHRHKL